MTTLPGGSFPHPYLPRAATHLKPCPLTPRTHSSFPSSWILSSSLLFASAASADLPRLLHPSATAPSFPLQAFRDLLESTTALGGGGAAADDAPSSVTWRASTASPPPPPLPPPRRVLHVDGGASEEQQVAEALDSVTFQPWTMSSSSSSSRSIPGTQPLRSQNRAPVVPRKKVDRWINPAVRKLEADSTVARLSGGTIPTAAESSAAQDSVRFSSTAIPLVNEAGARYQRLSINLDLQLYRARVLRQRGRVEQAVAILKQVLTSFAISNCMASFSFRHLSQGSHPCDANHAQDFHRLIHRPSSACAASTLFDAVMWQAELVKFYHSSMFEIEFLSCDLILFWDLILTCISRATFMHTFSPSFQKTTAMPCCRNVLRRNLSGLYASWISRL